MLDVRRPIALLFVTYGVILVIYGQFFSEWVVMSFPGGSFPLKLNNFCGIFMFLFGIIMWQWARYSDLKHLEEELLQREKEMKKLDEERQAIDSPAKEKTVEPDDDELKETSEADKLDRSVAPEGEGTTDSAPDSGSEDKDARTDEGTSDCSGKESDEKEKESDEDEEKAESEQETGDSTGTEEEEPGEDSEKSEKS